MDVKRPLRLVDCDPEIDAEIEGYIETATDLLQTDTRLQLVAGSFTLKMDCFPLNDRDILLPRLPLLGVDSVTYYDLDNASQTYASSNYMVHAERQPPRIELDIDGGAYWPDTYVRHDAVTVSFHSGYAIPLTPDASSDNFTSVGHTYSNGDSFKLSVTGGVMPDGFTATTTYYVVGVSGDTFQLSLTSGGAAITFSTNGAGTLFAGKVPRMAQQAIYKLVEAWYCGGCDVGCTNHAYDALARRLRWEVGIP